MFGPARLLESETDLADFLQYLYAPIVLVSASDRASKFLLESTGMSPADLFRPFGLSSQIVNSETASDASPLPVALRLRHAFDPLMEKAARCYKALSQFNVSEEDRPQPFRLPAVRFVDVADYRAARSLAKDTEALQCMHHLHVQMAATRTAMCKGRTPACSRLMPFTSVQAVGAPERVVEAPLPGPAARNSLTFQRSPLRGASSGHIASPHGYGVQAATIGLAPGLIEDSRHSQELPEEPWFPLLFEQLHTGVELCARTPVAVLFLATSEEFVELKMQGQPEKCFEGLMASLQLPSAPLTPSKGFILLHDASPSSAMSSRQVAEAANALTSILPPSACHTLKIGPRDSSLDNDALECIQAFFLSCVPVRPASLSRLHALSASSPKSPLTSSPPYSYPTHTIEDTSQVCSSVGWGELRDLFHLVRRFLRRTVVPGLARRAEQLDTSPYDRRTFRSQLRGIMNHLSPQFDRPSGPDTIEAQQASCMGDLLMWQGQYERAAHVYKFAASEGRVTHTQYALLCENQAVCSFLAGDASRRDLEQLFAQAHKEFAEAQLQLPHNVPTVSDLLSQATYFTSRLPKKTVSASVIASALFDNLPHIKELQKSTLLTRMALRSHMLASYILIAFVTHRPAINFFDFRPFGSLQTRQETDSLAAKIERDVEAGVLSNRELGSCVAAVDEAADLLRVAFFNWSEVDHRKLTVFDNLLRNCADVLSREGDASSQLFLEGLQVLSDVMNFVTKSLSLMSALLLERLSFALEVVGRVTSIVHWTQALPHNMPPVLPAARRMKRKSLFFLTFAGHMYNKLGLKDISLRCFHLVLPYFATASSALQNTAQLCAEIATKSDSVLDVQGCRRLPLVISTGFEPAPQAGCWRSVLVHLRFTMARQSFASDLHAASLTHFLDLLNSAAAQARFGQREKSAANRDAIHLKELLFVCKALGIDTPLPLSVPLVLSRPDSPSIFAAVLLEGDEPPESERKHFTFECSQVPRDVEVVDKLAAAACNITGETLSHAEEMELRVQAALGATHEASWCEALPQVVQGPSLLGTDTKMIEAFATMAGQYTHSPRTGGVGSAAAIEVILSNPLSVVLDCNKLRLAGVFTDESGQTSVFPQSSGSSPLEVFPFDCRLHAFGTVKVRFFARFNAPGKVVFTSIRWSLFHIIPCWAPLTVVGPPRHHAALSPLGQSVYCSPPSAALSLLVTARDATSVQETAWASWARLGDGGGRRSLGAPLPPAVTSEALEELANLPGRQLQRPLCLQKWNAYLPDYRLTISISSTRPRVSYLVRQWPAGPQPRGSQRRAELLIQNTGTVPIASTFVVVDSQVTQIAAAPRAYVDTSTISKGELFAKGASYCHPLLPGKCVSVPLKLHLTLTCRTTFLVMASAVPLGQPQQAELAPDMAASYVGSSVYDPKAKRLECPLAGRVWLLLSKPVIVD